MFTDKIESVISNILATIYEQDLIPKGSVTVIWSWNDDEIQIHAKKMNDLLCGFEFMHG